MCRHFCGNAETRCSRQVGQNREGHESCPSRFWEPRRSSIRSASPNLFLSLPPPRQYNRFPPQVISDRILDEL